MKKAIKRVFLLATGWFFLVLGVIGLFLPFLQGILFILIGLLILSSEYVWAHNLLNKLRDRFPRLSAKVDESHTRVSLWFQRRTG